MGTVMKNQNNEATVEGLLDTKKHLLLILESCIGSLVRDKKFSTVNHIKSLLKKNAELLDRVFDSPSKGAWNKVGPGSKKEALPDSPRTVWVRARGKSGGYVTSRGWYDSGWTLCAQPMGIGVEDIVGWKDPNPEWLAKHGGKQMDENDTRLLQGTPETGFRFEDFKADNRSIAARVVKQMRDAKEAARNHSIHFGPKKEQEERCGDEIDIR